MEYFDEAKFSMDSVKAIYERIFKIHAQIPKIVQKKLAQKTCKLFSGDYEVDLLPRILHEEEVAFLRRAVEQRARAILAFLTLYYSGELKWKKIIPPKVMKRIEGRYYSIFSEDQIQFEHLSFPYGPDLIRDSAGMWSVVEDSAGILGGMGDFVRSREILLRVIPSFRPLLKESVDTYSFYDDLAAHYFKMAKEKNGIPIFCFHEKEKYDDHEEDRIAQIYQSRGIRVLSYRELETRLVVKENEAFIEDRGKREKIGYIISRHCASSISRRYFLILFDRLKKMKKMDFSLPFGELSKLISKGIIGTNFSTGTELVNDKVFGLYVDKMIEVLLKEKPIVRSLTGFGYSPKRFRQFSLNKNRWVLKQADEDGGSGVFIGAKMSQGQILRLGVKVKESPHSYIIQKFTPLSGFRNRITDIRFMAHVDQNYIRVSDIPWGRSASRYGNGKVNLASKGKTCAVFVVK